MMMKKLIISAVAALLALAVVMLATHDWRKPAVLVIHVDGATWNQIIVRSSNFPETRVFAPPAEPHISPISHGEYVVGVSYSTGTTIWTRLFHIDAGVRRRVDLFLLGDPAAGSVRIREIANDSIQLFDGTASPDAATERAPFSLGGV